MEEEWWRIMKVFFSGFVLLFFMRCHDDILKIMKDRKEEDEGRKKSINCRWFTDRYNTPS